MRNLIVLSVLTVGLGMATLSANASRAARDEESNPVINKIADLLQKDDSKGAKKAAAEAAKKFPDHFDIMNVMLLRIKKGIGIGNKPGAIMPDGIEKQVMHLARNGIDAKALEKHNDAYVRAGYVIQAIAEYTVANSWPKDDGKQTKKAWKLWSDKLMESSQAFTAAAKANKSADLKKVAKKVQESCDGCHAIFKDE